MDDFYEDCLDEEMPDASDLGALRGFGDQTMITTARGPVPAGALRSDDVMLPMQTFSYSVTYLMMLFLFLMVDHYFMALTGNP